MTDRERAAFAKPLIMDVDAVAAHLTHSLRMVQGYRYGPLDADPLFSCLAIGMEKLAKLTIGLIGLDDAGKWARSQHTHDVVELDREARLLLRARTERSASTLYIEGLLDAVEADTVIQGVLETVSDYGIKGRYFNLDALAGPAPTRPSPHELWERVNSSLLQANASLLRRLASSQHDDARAEMNEVIATAIHQWWLTYARCWQHGVAGPTARQWSSNLLPQAPRP